MPFDIIRSLQFLQDQAARGNERAVRVQSLLLRRFGPVFLDTGAVVWDDARNRRAAILFVLSGGPPEVLAGLMRAGLLSQDQTVLFEGALAYVRNDLALAREKLGSLDFAGLEPGLAGHLSLVLGQILQDEDPAAAVVHLDRARLLAPGGLIEEAALRLQTLLVDGLGETERADRLARQYFDRYSRSAYSANFEARFAAIQSSRGAEDAEGAIRRMDDVVAGLPVERRRVLQLAVARRALVEGHLEFARLAARRALDAGGLDADEAERGRLYELASGLAGLPGTEAMGGLAALRRDRLHPEDLPILEAAIAVVGEIERPEGAAGSAGVDGQAPSPVVSRAERLLAETLADIGS